MSHSIAELRALSDDQLIAAHDIKAKSTDVGISYYLDEIRKREQDRVLAEQQQINEKMLVYTKDVERLTRVVTIATIISVVVSALSLTATVFSIFR